MEPATLSFATLFLDGRCRSPTTVSYLPYKTRSSTNHSANNCRLLLAIVSAYTWIPALRLMMLMLMLDLPVWGGTGYSTIVSMTSTLAIDGRSSVAVSSGCV